MSKLKKVCYELRDVAVVQAPVSFVNHRAEAYPYISICNHRRYPIFVSPMGAVTDQKNYKVWMENNFTPVVPRSVQKSEMNPDGLTFEERMEIAKETFVSVSLKEAQNELLWYLCKQKAQLVVDEQNGMDVTDRKFYICVDIAHGTLSELYDICRKLKDELGDNIELMTGNVANPEAYSFYADAGIDWMRVGIGGGSRCTTSCNVSVHYPMATLLDEIYEARKSYAHSHNGAMPTKIIADGGIGWFDDIQKALALGADAVMIGRLFAQSEEACGEMYYTPKDETVREVYPMLCQKVDEIGKIYYLDHTCEKRWRQDEVDTMLGGLIKVRDYYGMSTKRAQTETGGNGNITAEGISKPVPVLYTIAKWAENMESYLRSCMTYTNSRTIQELRENAQVIILGGSGDATYRK